MEAKSAVDARSSAGRGGTTASASTHGEGAASTRAPPGGAASADPARTDSSTTDGDRAMDIDGKPDAAHASRNTSASVPDPSRERRRREANFRGAAATGRS